MSNEVPRLLQAMDNSNIILSLSRSDYLWKNLRNTYYIKGNNYREYIVSQLSKLGIAIS